MTKRTKLTRDTQTAVLIECGYRCAVPTCRGILAIDLHHIVEVVEGGRNEAGNLLALCPTCHGLFHRGTYTRDAIYAWKGVVVALSQGFDRDSMDLLLFLDADTVAKELLVDGTGVLRFARLIAAGLALFRTVGVNGAQVLYEVRLTTKGSTFVSAWKRGDREAVAASIVPAGIDTMAPVRT